MQMKKDSSKKPMTLSNVEFLFKHKKIDMNPKYQREAVWKLSQKQLLIDSILRKIDIPKLYFRSISKGSYQYEVVDGQQRIRAIVEFMSGEYKLSDDCEDLDGKSIASFSYSKLPIELQMEFNNSQLDIVVMNEAYTDDDI
ncbi:MAG TPA: DUF262 domain-containing protein, partial [bacterium]|nr:DUF262 domain-containing protein [bacterium]